MNGIRRLTLKVLTPEGMIFEQDNLEAVNIPLADGCPIGVRPGHAPLIAETERGMVRFRTGLSEKEIELHAGVVDIRGDNIILLTAGEVEKTPDSLGETVPTEYDRLMQTLIQQMHLEDETEQEIQ